MLPTAVASCIAPQAHRRNLHLPFEPAPLLQALTPEAPSGPDLAYEAAFAALELAGAGKPERQYGDKIYAAEPPDWPTVHEQALALAATTRDLRVAMWLLRSGCRLHGLGGAAAGLQLLQGLLAELWDSVHPQLDASDNNDPTMRLSALAPLAAPEAALADLRSVALAPVRGSLTLRELELGLGKGVAAQDEAAPTEAGVLQALQALLATHPGLAAQATAADQAARAIAARLDDRLGAGNTLDLGPLTELMALPALAMAQLQPGAVSQPAVRANATSAPAVPTAAAVGAVGAAGAIGSRADALRELDRVCQWLESNEPANPAPLLIRRAQRLMNKSFLEIIRDLAPDGLAQIENLAGPHEPG